MLFDSEVVKMLFGLYVICRAAAALVMVGLVVAGFMLALAFVVAIVCVGVVALAVYVICALAVAGYARLTA